ncbi:hypothetical protein GCM10009535_42660 [Streptomyces thermocarboxydovorans]|uniref:Uncharacterized protein n=1 Tax=Streptomyces thermocarboxydovorans TaxID=59298 RepID=A0ABN1HMC5_9ACTN
MVQLLPGEPEAVGGRRGDQRVDLHPAALVGHQSDPFRLVAQVLGDVLGHPHGASLVHALSLPGETHITRLISSERFDPQSTRVIHRRFEPPCGQPSQSSRALSGGLSHTGGLTRATLRSTPGAHRFSAWATRASAVTGTTA